MMVSHLSKGARGWVTRARLLAPVLALLSALAALSAPWAAGGAAAQEGSSFSLIGRSGSTPQQTSEERLGVIFSGRKSTWESGVPARLVLMPEGSAEMRWLCKEVLNIPEELLRRFINQRVYRGVMSAPIEVKSVEEALAAVQQTPGAVAPVSLEGGAEGAQSALQKRGLHVLVIR